MALAPPPGSIWTVDTLKVVVDGELTAIDRRLTDSRAAADARATEAQEAIKVGLAAAQKALDAAAILAKDAVTEAKAAHAAEHAALAMALALAMLELKERLAEMNNFRKQIADERGDFVTRDRLATAVTTLEASIVAAIASFTTAIAVVDARVLVMEKAHADLQGRIQAYGSVLAIGLVVVNLFLKFGIQ